MHRPLIERGHKQHEESNPPNYPSSGKKCRKQISADQTQMGIKSRSLLYQSPAAGEIDQKEHMVALSSLKAAERTPYWKSVQCTTSSGNCALLSWMELIAAVQKVEGSLKQLMRWKTLLVLSKSYHTLVWVGEKELKILSSWGDISLGFIDGWLNVIDETKGTVSDENCTTTEPCGCVNKG